MLNRFEVRIPPKFLTFRLIAAIDVVVPVWIFRSFCTSSIASSMISIVLTSLVSSAFKLVFSSVVQLFIVRLTVSLMMEATALLRGALNKCVLISLCFLNKCRA